jgi:hypothetical protein
MLSPGIRRDCVDSPAWTLPVPVKPPDDPNTGIESFIEM